MAIREREQEIEQPTSIHDYVRSRIADLGAPTTDENYKSLNELQNSLDESLENQSMALNEDVEKKLDEIIDKNIMDNEDPEQVTEAIQEIIQYLNATNQ